MLFVQVRQITGKKTQLQETESQPAVSGNIIDT